MLDTLFLQKGDGGRGGMIWKDLNWEMKIFRKYDVTVVTNNCNYIILSEYFHNVRDCDN